MAATTKGGSRAARRLILALVLGLMACAAASTSAAAGTRHHAHVEGTYSVSDFGAIDCVGVSEFVIRCSTTGLISAYSGDLVGSSTADFEQTIDCGAGRTVGRGSEVFVGAVRGRPETLKWRITFASDFNCSPFYPFNFRGLGIVSQWGGLLKFDDTTYDGWLR